MIFMPEKYIFIDDIPYKWNYTFWLVNAIHILILPIVDLFRKI